MKADSAKSIGLQWSANAAGLAATPKATSVQTRVGGTPVTFAWNPQLKRYDFGFAQLLEAKP